jgi:predicted Zn-dependent peptidase
VKRALVLSLILCACGAKHAASFGPAKVDIPIGVSERPGKTAKASELREAPPPSGSAKESPFPAVVRSTLANGVRVAVVPAHALPVVQLRVLVRAGSGYGPAPGVAEVTADMLKDGGTRALSSAELLRRVETLGANLSVHTDFDATVLGMGITKDHLAEALALLAQVVREPRFDEGELKKGKARATDEAEDAARSNGSFGAMRVIFRELFPDKHPYATARLLPTEIAHVDGAQIREFHRRFYVPKATTVVIAGDVDGDAAKAAVDEQFGKWAGEPPPKIDFPSPKPVAKTHVVIANRPKSVQSDVFVAMIAPDRRSPEWARVRVANQVLGGGVASRLFLDVREQRSLAYRTNAQIIELAHGEQPLVLYAGTETSKTTQAVSALLENVTRMTTSPPSQPETDTARRYLADIFAVRMETIGSVADLVVTAETLGLPDGYWDAYRKELRATEAAQLVDAAKRMYAADRALVVVAGDADVFANDLARVGDVIVIDPEKEMKTLKSIPKAP